MTATPNMKTIHDQNPCAFSPQPFAIAGFFSPQQILQLVWMRELYRSPAQVENGTLRYVPWYAFGNICIALWMFLWVSSPPQTCLVFPEPDHIFGVERQQPQGIQHPSHLQHPHPGVLPRRPAKQEPKHLPVQAYQHHQHHLCRNVSDLFTFDFPILEC